LRRRGGERDEVKVAKIISTGIRNPD